MELAGVTGSGVQKQAMNKDEELALGYLTTANLGSITHEPFRNAPPDFSIDSDIAVEVRRLNNLQFRGSAAYALENIKYPLVDAMSEVFDSFSDQYAGRSFIVGLSYQASPEFEVGDVKQKAYERLALFLKSDALLPCLIPLDDDDQVTLLLHEGNPHPGVVFKAAFMDITEAHSIVEQYALGIDYCIREKSSKVLAYLQYYREWWLFLVDYIGTFPFLDAEEIHLLTDSVNYLGCFQRVCLVNSTAQELLLDLHQQVV